MARRAVPPVIAHTLALGGIGAHTMPGTIVHPPLVVWFSSSWPESRAGHTGPVVRCPVTGGAHGAVVAGPAWIAPAHRLADAGEGDKWCG